MVASVAAPDLFFTEFTNVDGLASEYGKKHVEHRLQFNPAVERPIIAQIWGAKPENYLKAAQYIQELGFDGIDINMGCPQKDVVKKGLCAALIENHQLASEVIKATQEGAGDLPVSVKTRIGVKNIATEEWIGFLLSLDLDALTVHGRTVKEMSQVPAHWDEISKAVEMRNKLGIETVIIGNGDVQNRQDGLEKVQMYGVDGVMIGRGLFQDIGVFRDNSSGDSAQNEPEMNIFERLSLLKKHLELWEATWHNSKNFNVMKKYIKIYIKDFNGASEMRAELMNAKTMIELQESVQKFTLTHFPQK
jgi:tRNA-dihydrouridine synthase